MQASQSVQQYDNKLIRVNDLLNRLGIGRSTLYRWIKSGTIPRPKAIGGTSSIVYWKPEQIETWLSSKETRHETPLSLLCKKNPKHCRTSQSKRVNGASGIRIPLF